MAARKSNIVKLETISLPPVETELSWFTQLVERGRRGIFTKAMKITPEMAKQFLSNNPNNRAISEHTVNTYTRDIKNNNWAFNGETILISVEGELNDGSHRMHAIIKANKSIKTLVVFGLPRESRMSVDTGRARRVNDFLNMKGFTSANTVAAVARIWLAYNNADYLGKWLTKQDVLHFAESNIALLSHATQLARGNKFYRAVGATAIAASYCIINKANSTLCDTFFDSFLLGAGLDLDSPILFLRQHCMLFSEQKLRMENKVELILRYWNAWRNDTKLSKRIALMQKYPTVAK